MSDLAQLQQWLVGAIRAPASTPIREIEATITDATGRLAPAARLGIYANSFHGRLVQCLETQFPVLKLALGDELFFRFAHDYLRQYPPSTYTLTRLGENLPRFLRQTRPPDPDELWPEFIINLATLERIFFEVYHGPGPEDGDAPPATDLSAIAAEPWTRVLELAFPVHDYFLAARPHLAAPDQSAPPEFPAPHPTRLLVFRRDFEVCLRVIENDNPG